MVYEYLIVFSLEVKNLLPISLKIFEKDQRFKSKGMKKPAKGKQKSQ